MKKFILRGLAFLVITLSLYFCWGIIDVNRPDETLYLPPPYLAVEEQDNAYPLLQNLCNELSTLELPGKGLAFKLDLAYDTEEERALTNQILALPLMQELPKRLEQIVSKPHYQVAEFKSFDDIFPALGTYSRISQLMKAIMTQQLFLDQQDQAIQTALLHQRFVRMQHDNSQTLIHILVANACHGIFTAAMIDGADKGLWNEVHLRQLMQDLKPIKNSAQHINTCFQYEYKVVMSTAKELLSQSEVKMPSAFQVFSYHPNRTRKMWIDVMGDSMKELAANNLLEGYRKAGNIQTTLNDIKKEVYWGRNFQGVILLAIKMPITVQVIGRMLEFQVRHDLLKLRCALEIYRLKHGTWPTNLSLVKDKFKEGLPKDPWSGGTDDFLYLPKQGKVYSLGNNQRDDKGNFLKNHSFTEEDYGLLLPMK